MRERKAFADIKMISARAFLAKDIKNKFEKYYKRKIM